MRRNAFIAFALVLALAAVQVYATNASMYVPAVVTNGAGEMILLSVEVRNGTGNIYTSTDPLVGIDTQQSERTAVENAMAVLGRNASRYDVFLTMDVGDTKQVDGPSAGAAMTLLTISALEGRRIRGDFTITGTIEDGGKIGAVGGVFKKVEAASARGIRLVLVPRESDAFEKVALASLMARLNVTVIEVGEIGEAREMAFSAEGYIPRPRAWVAPPPLSLQPYSFECSGCGLEKFRVITGRVVNRSADEVESVAASNRVGVATALPLLRKELADSRTMLENDYLYTAANTAFLNLANAQLLSNGTMNRESLSVLIDSVEGCQNSIDRGRLTRENVGWRIGADLRATWSRNKLAEVKRKELEIKDNEELLAVYKDALLAKNWCEVAKEFYSAAAETGGRDADEGALRNLALMRVAEARTAIAGQEEDADLKFHLSSAEMAMGSGMYGAAVYDADYVLGTVRARNLSIAGDAAIVEKAREFAARKGKVLWSALFFAHASYYDAVGGGAGTVARLGYIADGMENDTGMMGVLFENPGAVPAPPVETWIATGGQEEVVGLNEALLVMIVLLSILLITSAILNIIVYTRAISMKKSAAKPRKRR